ncbi:MAG: hypothetical protein LBD29_05675 [Treponema sp.]|nr:hypothetical protein [Treponema sp.]
MTFFIYSCTRKTEEVIIVPPPTYPLSQSAIGYGVINESFTLVMKEPAQSEISLGHLRKGSIVRVLERRSISNQGKSELWVLVEGTYRGWLKEEFVDIYDLEAQAGTAALVMNR